MISFKNSEPPNGSSIDLIFQAKSILYYETTSKSTGRYTDLYEEPYDEAYKIVMGHSPGSQNLSL